MHRSRFIAARAILRTLAAGYLDLAPGDVEFCYGKNGKPEIAHLPLHINVSHSDDQGVFAFTQIAPLGVDLEHVRPVPEMLDIAHRFFSPSEAAAISAVPEPERTVAFFRCWTRKEAFIKSTGVGLSFALDRFAVSLDESAALLYVEPDAAEASEWSLFHLAPEEGYVGALAIRRRAGALAIMPFINASERGRVPWPSWLPEQP
jgi:4'-phosphopantetheinyl transferase